MPVIDSVDMGKLTDFLFVFTNGSAGANWQGPSKGFVGDVAVGGSAAEHTSGFVPYAGRIFTDAPAPGAWQQIVNANPGQAAAATGQAALLGALQAALASAFTQIDALPATGGFENRSALSLDGLNTQNGIKETLVINITSGLQVAQPINITGDAGDVFILRWDTDPLTPGYQGQVMFQSGGGIVPHGGLTPANFISVAGDIAAAGGGATPPPPYPQGPRFDNGQGPLLNLGQDFNGGGFFTGYWLTTGDPVTGETSPLSDAIFAGGWYTSTAAFSMTSGTSGVHVSPNPAAIQGPAISLTKRISVSGAGGPFVESPTSPGVILISPQLPFFQLNITNVGTVPLTGITLTDTGLGPITLPTTTLPPGGFISMVLPGSFAAGTHCNTATTTGAFVSGTCTCEVSAQANACFTGATAPAIVLLKLISVDNGANFQPASNAPFPTLLSPTLPQYKFLITNIGNTTLDNITLSDNTGLPVPAVPVSLAPGQSFTTGAVTGSFAAGQHCNTATVSGTPVSGTPVSGTPAGGVADVNSQSTACFVGEAAGITIVKKISVSGPNGPFVPASTPPFPTLVSPSQPFFQFDVTNTGTASITGITVVDTVLGQIALPTTTLAPGQSFTTTPVAGAFAVGEHCNTATVSGTSLGLPVTDTSAACFIGEAPVPVTGITIVKEISVSGAGGPFVPAGTPPFPTLPAGTNPFFRFVVTNTGTAPITGITVTDTALGPISLQTTTLGPGASFTTTPVQGTFAGGQHCNTATVHGTSAGQPVTATSTACFTGAVPAQGIAIVKELSVSGPNGPFVPASTPPFPTLPAGNTPLFRFVITNTGTAPITGITVFDTALGPINLPNTTLGPGESFTTVPVPGAFAVGKHCNTATVNGTAAGQPVTGASTACFTGVVPATPVFPNISGPAPQNQIIDRLLETVALEELALAALINAEAEKVQAVAAAGVMGPVDPEDLVAINQSVAAVIAQAAEKERRLLSKLNRILAHKERQVCDP